MRAVSIEPIAAFSDNYIWLLHDGRDAVVVDPGDAAPVMAALRMHGVQLAAILVTHHHGDHVGGLPALLQHRQVPVYGPAGEDIALLTQRLNDGDAFTLQVWGAQWQVLQVPGHTLGHIAFYCAALPGGPGPVLMCGDTLFSAGCGRLFEGTPAQMLGSLDRLAALPGDTAVYCAHEYTVANLRFAQACDPHNPARDAYLARCLAARAAGQPTLPSSLALERDVNPFLRCDVPQVQAAVAAHAGTALRTREAVFAAMRGWKN
ncbi:MAG: hydroxyacylglutathione hydrolase, partial [Betaproteobacteria bacterium]|nr:hydroxyacylglutathione hydrolase [Betaproteobacteria bacterium]